MRRPRIHRRPHRAGDHRKTPRGPQKRGRICVERVIQSRLNTLSRLRRIKVDQLARAAPTGASSCQDEGTDCTRVRTRAICTPASNRQPVHPVMRARCAEFWNRIGRSPALGALIWVLFSVHL